MKDERFLKTDQEVYDYLQLSNFPNFSATGNVEGMRKIYYGEDAFLVQAGDYIYHVDEDTFQAVKDYDFLRQQPESLQKINGEIAAQEMKNLPKYDKGSHEYVVMELAVKAELMTKMLQQIDKSITDAKLAGPNAVGNMYISCNFNGEHQLVTLTKEDKRSLVDSLYYKEKIDGMLKMIAARELAEPLFKSLMPLPNAMDENHILDTADKIATVLQKFYSLHEAEELTRIITDPEKTVEDVKQVMTNIQKREWEERGLDNLQSKITGATFLLPNDKDVTLWVNIHGVQMPVKTLTETDAGDIRNILNGDRSQLTVEDIQDKAKDLALTYYKEELQMSYDQLLDLTAKSDITLSKEDARSYIDLENALKQKFPDGLTLSIPDFTVTDIYSYIHYGKFRDEDFVFAGIGEQLSDWDNCLKAEVVLPNKNLHQLAPAPDEYSDESYEDFINDLDNAEAFDASTTELMHRHPDLNGAKFTLYDHSIPKFMHIEGHLLDEAIAWVLQKPDISEDTLRKVLNDKEEERNLLNNIAATEVNEYDRNRIVKAGMPEGLDMIQQDERLYLFERGTLGFAEVDRMRGVRYNGDNMSQQAQQYINDFVLNKNIENKHGNTFFLTPGANSEIRAYLNTMKNELVMVNIEQSIYGNNMNTKGSKILKEGDMQHFQDITGRVTDARIFGITNPLVRCKIDGVQQSGKDLTKEDRIRLGHYMSNTADLEKFALSMAVKYFAVKLDEDIQQNRTRGCKR